MSLSSNPDPGRTLAQFGIAVVALVVVAAGLFWGIDLISAGDDVSVAAPSPAASPSPAATSVAPSPATPTPSPPAASPSPEPTEVEPSPTPAESTPEPSPQATEEPTEETESPSPEATEEPSEDETDSSDVDHSETSVQVLDAIKDGSGRAREVADDLEDDGYRLVAFGPSSIIYDNTTVFWTDGHEDEARELADANGWDEVVFNDILSETVDVHVVVGLDEAE